MDKQEIINKIITLKLSKKLIEQLTGMPANNFSKWVKNPEKLPNKWAIKLQSLLSDIEKFRPDTSSVAEFINSLFVSLHGSLFENLELKAEICRLQPSADSWNQRMTETTKAIEKAPKAVLTTNSDQVLTNEEINAQIKAIQSEKIPEHRDTLLGRKVWRVEQDAKINRLRKQLTPQP